MTDTTAPTASQPLRFRFGAVGALIPFAVFLIGVAWLGLSGAPDERGFWPVLIAALACGLALARDRTAYAEAVIAGMGRPIVLLMVMAWLLAGVLASLLGATGLVEALVWICRQTSIAGGAYAAMAFVICAVVSTATGTSLGTLLLCAPLLYPAGPALGADPAVLIGAILGGATFGDNVSPVSDTTIASANTQGADMRGVVLSRLRYALPAAAVALVGYGLLGAGDAAAAAWGAALSATGLPMLGVPAVVIALLLARQHLLVGLMLGAVSAAALGVALGLIAPSDLMHLEGFGARGLVVDGVERGVGISIFTILLAGLVAGIEGSGLIDRLVERLGRGVRSTAGAERAIFATVSAAVLLTTHSVVAILTVGTLTRRLGERFRVGPYRRANLLDVTVCTYPFLLPYMIPTLLAASLTAGRGEGAPAVSALQAGLWNLHSWALLVAVLLAVFAGYGRRRSG
jgi:Na+/H+ antiporter NhaC